MKLNHTDAAVRAGSISAETNSSSGEIDLYDDLTAFAKLSPEEQMRLVDRPEKTSTETETPAADEAEEEHPSTEPLLAPAPIEPVESQNTTEETENTSQEKAEEHPSPEPVLALAAIESVEAEAAALPEESAPDASASKSTDGRSKVRPELFVR